MKNYDPTTRKRPVWEEFWNEICVSDIEFKCLCGDRVVSMSRKTVFEHWEKGHFDVYEEYNDIKTNKNANIKG